MKPVSFLVRLHSFRMTEAEAVPRLSECVLEYKAVFKGFGIAEKNITET